MRRFKVLALLLIISSAAVLSIAEAPKKHYVSFETPGELQSYLRWTPQRIPLISAHRGGPLPGYPENCIATFENTLSFAPCMLECDVSKSKDAVLVLMHDDTLDRTTTGKGKVSDYALQELRRLKLRDNNGRITPYVIPTLAEVLEWARGKAVVELDIKRMIPPEEIVSAIREKHADSYTVVITYSTKQAAHYYRLDPSLMISGSAKGIEGARRLLDCGVSPKNLVAFVGVYEPSEDVYNLLHKHGIRAMLGTMGNLDQKAERHGVQVYNQFLKNGADVLVTNNVPLASKAGLLGSDLRNNLHKME